MHVRWIMFLQKFSFVLHHKADKSNKVAYALSRRASLLMMLQTEAVGLESIKEQYASDKDFTLPWDKCISGQTCEDYNLRQGYLFKGNQLCVPDSSLRNHLIKEMHSGGLAAHVGKDKMLAQLQAKFFWPKLQRDVCRFVEDAPFAKFLKVLLKIRDSTLHCQFRTRYGRV